MAADVPAAQTGPVDVESTWAVKPTPREEEQRNSEPDEAAAPSYDYLFGHTVTVDEHRQLLAEVESVEDGEPDPPEAPAPSSLPPPSTSPAPVPPPTPSPATPSPAIPSTATPSTGGGLISSVPWATGATSRSPVGGPMPEPQPDVPSFSGRHTPPPAPSLLPPPTTSSAAAVAEDPTEGHEDVDELTIDRSALLEARHAAQIGGASGPSVVAVLCSQGHPTPPHGDSCRICGSGIPPQETFTMARPPLGSLRLSTGDVVTLDRSVLMGRSPTLASDLTATDRPHVVKVPSPERDVSRNHVEVVLEGWHVLIRDLGTTNGTTVALPGGQPVRLGANDQQVLEPGSVVSMADEVSFVFDPGAS